MTDDEFLSSMRTRCLRRDYLLRRSEFDATATRRTISTMLASAAASQRAGGTPLLIELCAGECDTDTLSPYPRVATVGEKMNHDEFMRRAVAMSSLDGDTQARQGREPRPCVSYENSQDGRVTKAMSLSSHEMAGWRRCFA
jgi:hypothetical protein